MENSEQCIEIAKMELNSIDETIKSKQATLKTIVNTFILLNSGIFFFFQICRKLKRVTKLWVDNIFLFKLFCSLGTYILSITQTCRIIFSQIL